MLILCWTVTLDADWARLDTRLKPRVSPAQPATWITVQPKLNVSDSLCQKYMEKRFGLVCLGETTFLMQQAVNISESKITFHVLAWYC